MDLSSGRILIDNGRIQPEYDLYRRNILLMVNYNKVVYRLDLQLFW